MNKIFDKSNLKKSKINDFFNSTFSKSSKYSNSVKRTKKKKKKNNYSIFSNYTHLEKTTSSFLENQKKKETNKKNKNFFYNKRNDNYLREIKKKNLKHKNDNQNTINSELIFNTKDNNFFQKYSLTDKSVVSNVNVMNIIENLELENKKLKEELKELNDKKINISNYSIFKKNERIVYLKKLMLKTKSEISNLKKKKKIYLFEKNPQILFEKINDCKNYYQNKINKSKNRINKEKFKERKMMKILKNKKNKILSNNKFMRKKREFDDLKKKHEKMSENLTIDMKDLLILKIKEIKLRKKLNNYKNFNTHIS